MGGTGKPTAAYSSWRAAVALGIAALSSGCGLSDAPILDPKGPIALAERGLLFTAILVMLIVVVPVFVLAVGFTWRYRASNNKARYEPDWSYSGRIDGVIWLVPALIVAALGIHVWIYTHKLDPYKRLASSVPPIEVEVVAQDWKWLFIYPKQEIAVVNRLVFPSGTPLSLRITSDTVMNSFFIPALGGQIYAMAGMQTRLNLLAFEPGRFMGRNVQYSGGGFADQHFEAIATPPEEFNAWVEKVKQSANKLDVATYCALAKPSRKHPVTSYSTVERNLFDRIVAKYAAGRSSAEKLVSNRPATASSLCSDD